MESSDNNFHSSTKLSLFIEFLIPFSILIGFALFIAIVLGLVVIYIKCTRPGRICKKIPIEYLDSSEKNSETIRIMSIVK